MESKINSPNGSKDENNSEDGNPTSKIDIVLAKESSLRTDDDHPEGDDIDSLAFHMKNFSLSSNVLSELSIYGIASYIKKNNCKNIITMVGAGISTAAGIPDFRTPGTGIYHKLLKYGLPYPQAIFEIDYFHNNPGPFYKLAANLLPGDYRPTKSHCFIKLLENKGLLLRHFTQNIDNLDREMGISEEKLIEAHGTFTVSHCTACRHEYGLEWLKRQIKRKRIPQCVECNKVVKPDIVFFGENLPQRFYENIVLLERCDLLIIMGTSLEVEPFASLASRAPAQCPRLMINLTPVGDSINFLYGKKNNVRDVLWIGQCDFACQLLANELGWGDDLLKLTYETRVSAMSKETAETSC